MESLSNHISLYFKRRRRSLLRHLAKILACLFISPPPLKVSVLQFIGRSVFLAAVLVHELERRVPLGVVPVPQRSVALVVERRVVQSQTANKLPDVAVSPAEDGVDPHHARPVAVRHGEGALILRARIAVARPK